MNKNLKLVFLLAIVTLLFATSCEKEKIVYQTKIRNSCEKELLGLPFLKYDIVEVKLNDEVVFKNVKFGEESEYKEIESSTEYEITVTYDSYTHDPDAGIYKFTSTETKTVGTEEWTDTEDGDKFVMVFEIGALIESYKPVFKTYIAN
jgi:hypothetical protein